MGVICFYLFCIYSLLSEHTRTKCLFRSFLGHLSQAFGLFNASLSCQFIKIKAAIIILDQVIMCNVKGVICNKEPTEN